MSSELGDVNRRIDTDVDVIVVGGGPGGSTISTLLALSGHRVVLFEREQFPRHQIGESLLPATVHGICPLLGIKEEIDQAGFMKKNGGTFRWGSNPTPWTFRFALKPDSPMAYAYQVERARFDHMLLTNARRKGVDVRERHNVHGCLMDGDRVTGVRYSNSEGVRSELRARFVVDSCGHSSNLHKLVGDRVFSKFFQNIALYAYFENGKRLPAPNSGNILSAAFDEGWFWYIPLSNTLTSVGVVFSKERAPEALRDGEDVAFKAFVKKCPLIEEFLTGASRVTEGMYGSYRTRKDYSYCSTRFWRPGLVLVGDAACFVDPVFSSGVHLSTYSALLGARSINTVLNSERGEITEEMAFREFERRYRREFGFFYQFLISFYDYHHDEASYFWQARKVLESSEEASAAFVRLVSGLSDAHEPVFAAEQPLAQAVMGLGQFFRGLEDKDHAEAAFGQRGKSDVATFMGGLTRELTQVQLQANLGERRPREAALFEDGLVPSRDGLLWCK